MEENGIVCPSGLRIQVRGLKLREFKFLSDRKAVASGAAFDEVLTSCVDVIDPGPAYAAGSFNWKTTALQGDRFYALMRVRCATHGDSYEFDANCPACRKRVAWTVELPDLRVQRYPKIAIEKHAARERFSTTLAGKRIEFTLLTAEDEKRVAKLLNADDEDPLIAGLAYRLRSVEGLDRDEVKPWLETLDLSDVFGLRDELDAVSGGVHTSISIECKRCGEFEVEIPFGGPGYWTPKTKRARASSEK
jgi:hypothetical protein